MPSGFVYDNTLYFFVSGRQHLYLYVDRVTSEDYAPYYTFSYVFNSDTAYADTRTKTDLCAAVSARILAVNLGRPPIVTVFPGVPSTVEWTNGLTSNIWLSTSAKLTPTQISTYCSTAAWINVYWAL